MIPSFASPSDGCGTFHVVTTGWRFVTSVPRKRIELTSFSGFGSMIAGWKPAPL